MIGTRKNGVVAKEEEQWGCCARKKKKLYLSLVEETFIDFSLI
jgi:hypothetical protein